MTERFDVLVLGAGPAGSLLAAQAAAAGRSVLLLERGAAPGATGPSAAVLRGGPRDWPGGLAPVVERSVAEHRFLVLDEAASISFDFRDAPVGPADARAPAIVRSEVLAGAWARFAVAHGAHLRTEVTDWQPLGNGAGARSGVSVGGSEFAAAVTVETEVRGSGAVGCECLEETYSLAPTSIDLRFQQRPGQGVATECALGFLPAPWTGTGYLLTDRDRVTLGVSLIRPAADEPATGLESAFDRFLRHPGVRGYTSGATRVDRRSFASVRPPTARELAGPGAARIGPALGATDPLGVIAPGMAESLTSALALAESLPGPGASFEPSRYRRRLAAHGVSDRLAHHRANPIPFGWDGRRRTRYAQAMTETFHALLTETGAPKESVTRTLRRVRRDRRLGYASLALDVGRIARAL